MSDKTPPSPSNGTKMVPYVYGIITILILVAGVILFWIWYNSPNETLLLMWGILLVGFAVAMATSVFRKDNHNKEEEITKILTEIKCRSCKEIEIRDFKQGDSVFKQAPNCTKCAGTRYISGIFPFQDEKNKEKNEEGI